MNVRYGTNIMYVCGQVCDIDIWQPTVYRWLASNGLGAYVRFYPHHTKGWPGHTPYGYRVLQNGVQPATALFIAPLNLGAVRLLQF